MGLKGTSGILDIIGAKDELLLCLVFCLRLGKSDLVKFWNLELRCADVHGRAVRMGWE
jgi:hypothetical protein